ncbi:MAG: hypothetical protein Dbin4_02849 [Alphaproteobacteria bacterium]|nr:hypothetical protein [Alphaproteobacteria bacterium]
MKGNLFYVYVLRHPDGVPLYVGKGCGDRAKRHLSRSHSQFVNRIISKIRRDGGEPILDFIFETADESAAHAKEIEVIGIYGRRNNGTGCLANLTDGGEGQSGRICSDTTKKKIGAKSAGRECSVEARAKISKAHKGRKHTVEAVEAYRAAAIARATPEYRAEQAERTKVQWTPERRAKQSARLKAKWADQPFRDNISEKNSIAAKAQWADPVKRDRCVASKTHYSDAEWLAAQSARTKEQWANPAFRELRSNSAKAQWLRQKELI